MKRDVFVHLDGTESDARAVDKLYRAVARPRAGVVYYELTQAQVDDYQRREKAHAEAPRVVELDLAAELEAAKARLTRLEALLADQG